MILMKVHTWKCQRLTYSERPKREKLVSAETEASATFTEASAEASAESLVVKEPQNVKK